MHLSYALLAVTMTVLYAWETNAQTAAPMAAPVFAYAPNNGQQQSANNVPFTVLTSIPKKMDLSNKITTFCTKKDGICTKPTYLLNRGFVGESTAANGKDALVLGKGRKRLPKTAIGVNNDGTELIEDMSKRVGSDGNFKLRGIHRDLMKRLTWKPVVKDPSAGTFQLQNVAQPNKCLTINAASGKLGVGLCALSDELRAGQ